MTKVRFKGGRTVLLLVVAGAALGIWQGVAGASSKAGVNTIWGHRDSCSEAPNTYPVGTVRVTRLAGKRFQVRVAFTNAEPNDSFTIFFFYNSVKNDGCGGDEVIGTVNTDANGIGKGTFVTSPHVAKYVYIDAYNGVFANETDWLLI